jgi:hypothetical protein
MSIHARNWDEIRQVLKEARTQCAPQRGDQPPASVSDGLLVGTLDEFNEFLEHNELELAWDALAEVAERSQATRECWYRLARAADLMGLTDKRDKAQHRATPPVTSDQALAVARRDAEGVYQNLLEYWVSLVLEPDGWHVDYQLKNPRLHGGGPHYVIDAQTGVILSKRYEQ